MTARLEYFYTLISPWTYFGGLRLAALVGKFDIEVVHKPTNFQQILAETGGLPLAKRHPARQAYRLQELARWRDELGVPLNSHPKYFPASDNLANRCVIALGASGDQLALSNAVLKAVWTEEKDIADIDTLAGIIESCGLEAAPLIAKAESAEVVAELEKNTLEAIETGVFGAPTWKFENQLYWGQDRLFFIEQILAGRG